ncbi:MAG TPA: cation diffusion facilitator family transporter [Thermoanaerobaculia bacterium]|nr:cation diffusion facilitator family transporter [Thermoanaerobaculia bacterium]
MMELARAHPRSHEDTVRQDGDRKQWRRRVRAALALTAAVLLLEVAGGLFARSLALLADAAHMFADIAALLLAYAGMTLAGRAPTGRHTFGLYRAEILAAFVNAQILLLLAFYVGYEALRRFERPVEVHTGTMFWIAILALCGNLASMALLSRGKGSSLNLRAAYLEVFTDMLSSLAVVAAAVLMPLTGWHWLDAAVSAGVALFILPRAIGLLRQSTHILLEGAPGEIDLPALRRRILDLPGVEELHDLHFWTLTSGLHSASVHVRASADTARGEVLSAVQKLLRDEAGVDHATIQLEWGAEMTCHASSREHA